MRKKKRFLIDGTAFYYGKPCSKCGETVRYGSSGNCRRCNLEQIEQYKQRVALAKMEESPVVNSGVNRSVTDCF